MRALLTTAILLTVFGVLVVGGGWYPVAVVGNIAISYRTWRRAEGAARRFAETERRRSGLGPGAQLIETQTVERNRIQREALTFLIEDAILRQEGPRLVEDFEEKTNQKVHTALAARTTIQSAAQLRYGLDYEDFQELVLFPQARGEVVAESLNHEGKDALEWLEAVRRRAPVRLHHLPLRWDGEEVR